MIHNGLAAGIGAGVGIIPALLINRYLLKNKTGSSALRAALIGGGIGAAGGIGLNTYLRGKMLKQQQQAIQEAVQQTDKAESLNEYLQTGDLDSPEAEEKVREALAMMKGVAPDQITDEEIDNGLVSLEVDRFRKSVEADPQILYTKGTQSPLLPLPETTRNELDRLAGRFRSNNRRDVGYEYAYGGNLSLPGEKTGTQEVFNRILHSRLGTEASRGNPRTMAALINYHSKLRAIGQSDIAGKLPKDLRATLIDYMAIRAMPEEQRRFVPMMHRMTATARANASKGWSYEIDHAALVEPEAYQSMMNIAGAGDQLLDLATLMTSPTPSGSFLVLAGDLTRKAIGSAARRGLPEWGSDMHYANRNTIRGNFWRNSAVDMLSATDSGIPLYSWQIPEIARQKGYKALTGFVADTADMGFDLYRTGSGLSKLKRGFKTLAPKASTWKKTKRVAAPLLFDVPSTGLNSLSLFYDWNLWRQSRQLSSPGAPFNIQLGGVANNNDGANLVNAYIEDIYNKRKNRRKAKINTLK